MTPLSSHNCSQNRVRSVHRVRLSTTPFGEQLAWLDSINIGEHSPTSSFVPVGTGSISGHWSGSRQQGKPGNSVKHNNPHAAIRSSLLLLLLLLLVGCSDNSGEAGNSRERLIPGVEAVQADVGSLPLTERLSGVVRARNQVEIFPEISAVIEQVHVENGDDISKGEPLVSLRDREFQERLNQARAALQIARAQARQAEARLKEAQSILRRTRALAEQELTNEAELENVETQALSAEADYDLAVAQVEQAEATVAEREELVAQTVIRAPVDGTVGTRNAEVGMMVGPSTRLFTLGQLDSVRVEVVLTDLMLNYIESGQRADIQSSNLPGGLTSESLSRISPFLHPVTHSTEAEIDMANPDHDLKSGMFVTVDIHYGESEQATLIPLSALYKNPLSGATGVYVARDTANNIPEEPAEAAGDAAMTEPVTFEFVPVEVVAKGRMSAGIRGIEPGQWVVSLGQDLFGGETGQARVRAVTWSWVENLQQLQREDLLQEIVQKQDSSPADATDTVTTSPGS
ncbi:efflux RND transporter periplasmic adaptor subunit [candidate division GN15 bacterium]|nr:efflux RND transporter periplasmic adaptor subunit [candidate division GN15 bacterium]